MFIDICYAGFCLAAAPYACFRAVADRGFRRALGERLFLRTPMLDEPRPGTVRVWVHGVSVGEVLAARPLVESLLGKRGDLRERGFNESACEVVVSTTTPAGESVARNVFPDTPVLFFPFDFSHIVRAYFAAVRPSVVVLVEQELWPNFLEIAAQFNVPVLVVNGRMTAKAHARYSYFPGLARTMMRRLALVCALDEEHARRFLSCGADPRRVLITGNMKYDSFQTTGEAAADMHTTARRQYRELAGVSDSEVLIVGGSTHAPEEEWLLNSFAQLKQRVGSARLLLAPRHIQRVTEVERAIRGAGFIPVRRSALGPPGAAKTSAASTSKPSANRDRQVLILDTVGELRLVYHAADIVFVGGSLIPHGGQNVLEPAMAGKPVVFGPHMFNFSEAARLLENVGAAVVATNPADLVRALGVFALDAPRAAAAGAAGAAAVRQKQGATDRHLNAIATVLNTRSRGGTPGKARATHTPF